jgi:hypothetical protein
MHHPFPKLFKGNYPFAVLHAIRNEGIPSAISLAKTLSREEMTNEEAVQYVKAVSDTRGHPQILDLIEREKEEV